MLIMQGFPVKHENRVPREDWDRAPWNRWSFLNMRQILPTAEVWRGENTPSKIPSNAINLAEVEFESRESGFTNIEAWLSTSYTDGFMVLHAGRNAFEQYYNGMSHRTLHLAQSVSKSVVGSVAGILIGKGLLDPAEFVTHYLPELEGTAWKGATLQQVMDMTTGVRYIEEYEALDSDIARTDVASGWKPAREDFSAPDCIWDQILTLRQTTRPHGELFEYRSIETDVLAHCMERVTSIRLSDLVSRELWQPLGCEESACFTIDSAGYALADGGFNATLRDYARFGQMLLRKGFANGQQIVPAAWVEDIRNADGNLFHEPYNVALPDGAYRNQFWIEDVNRRGFMARGVFGQLIYIDPENDMVVVKLSSWPEFTSVSKLRESLSAIHAIARFLSQNGQQP